MPQKDETDKQRVWVECQPGTLRAARVKAAEEGQPLARVLGSALDRAFVQKRPRKG